jgi:hypothetical protein
MLTPPRDIRRFEMLQIGSLFVGAIHHFAVDDPSIGSFIVLGIIATLTLLVSRRCLNWARWVLLVMLVLGVILGLTVTIWMDPSALPVRLSPLELALTWAINAAQAVALAFAFTRQSSRWLNSKPSEVQP